MGQGRLHLRLLRLDRRVPLAQSIGLPVEVAAVPVDHLLAVLVRREGREVKRDEPAAPLHLPTHERHAVGRLQMRRFLVEIAVAPVRDHHDRRRVLERALVFGPTVEVELDRDAVPYARVVEHHFQKAHRPRVVVDAIALRTVALLAGDEHDFLKARGISGGQRGTR